MLKRTFLITLLFVGIMFRLSDLSADTAKNSKINLAGEWQFQLDPENIGEQQKWYSQKFIDKINLPGTTDQAGYGKKTIGSDYGVLTRVYKYIGAAWYQREIDIPENWREMEITLFLERVIWESKVYVDGKELDRQDALATPHIYKLGKLDPRKHILTIRVDNDTIYNIGDKGHAYSEYMQTIWNGVVGKIELRARAPFHIHSIRTFPNAEKKQVGIELNFANKRNKKSRIKIAVYDKQTNDLVGQIKATISGKQIMLDVPIIKDIKKWDEFSPNLYLLVAELSTGTDSDKYETTFGFRTVSTSKSHVLINEKTVFLRGNLDCIHFPLTGYPAMDVPGWKRIFKIYKDYGLNHVRFHSWCPPEAAFVAADELGFYIQAEASVWIDWWMGRTKEESKQRPEMYTKGEPKGLGPDNLSASKFVEAEINRVIDTYGNHPSFIMFCIGNELGNSNFNVMGEWMRQAKEKDPRRLYAASTARTVTQYCDYSATHYYPNVGKVRQHMINHNNWDYENHYSRTPVPTIAHEIGQWPVYPEWAEIDKYTGVVRARNLEGFREQAKQNGIFEQDKYLRQASGKLSILLYKDEIESFMRTPSCGGIQLLSMQDYQGQGEALIGWLDCFYDSKGIVTPEDFRKFQNTTVPLVKLTSYIFEAGDSLNAEVLLHHFGAAELKNQPVYWELKSDQDNVRLSGLFEKKNYPRGTLSSVGDIAIELPDVKKAKKITLRLKVEGTDFENSWNIWIYPKYLDLKQTGDILITEELDTLAYEKLNNGGKVLLIAHQLGDPENTKYAAWRPLYWSASFFPGQSIETIGLLLQKDHPAFAEFPTDNHSDWQWWNICKNARGFVLDLFPKGYKPIAQPVSDFHFNHKLGAIFELKYGKGKLMVCGYDITSEKEKLPEVRQLKYSLLKYMNSDRFQPEMEVEKTFLTETFKKMEEAPSAGPVGFENAILYVKAAAKRVEKGNAKWKKSDDRILVAKKVEYKVTADGSWKDDVGTSWFGKNIEIGIKIPEGILGDFYVYFHDWDSNKRRGLLNFEGQDYMLGVHDKKGKWIKFNVMREDTNDGKLILKGRCTGGANLMVTAIAFIPED